LDVRNSKYLSSNLDNYEYVLIIDLYPIVMVGEHSSPSGQEIRSKSMKGLILHLSEGGGLISGDDNSRYSFLFADILTNPKQIFVGSRVDFQIEGDKAIQIIPISGGNNIATTGGVRKEKDKLVAGLLAIFLGGLGIHKFYLGYTNPGIWMLIMGTVGWLLILPPFVVAIIALIEGIIYLTKSDQEFYEIYELNQKGWF
jgi:TM2 domain-containing membrane protein YozV|tara:strand:+ start:69 stop:665 length:597 start_codon:yes stop_codon:yes gene_type:complete